VFLRNKETNVGSEKGWNNGESNACCLGRNFFHFFLFIKPPFLNPRLLAETLFTPETFSCYGLDIGRRREALSALLCFVFCFVLLFS